MRSRMTTRGRTTVPREVRAVLGLKPGDEIAWTEDGDGWHASKVPRTGSKLEKWAGSAELFAGLDTDEIIDQMRGERLK